jgi:hypothetical protein
MAEKFKLSWFQKEENGRTGQSYTLVRLVYPHFCGFLKIGMLILMLQFFSVEKKMHLRTESELFNVYYLHISQLSIGIMVENCFSSWCVILISKKCLKSMSHLKICHILRNLLKTYSKRYVAKVCFTNNFKNKVLFSNEGKE